MSKPKIRSIQGAPSWAFQSDRVRAWLTCVGGHLAPIEFKLGKRTVQPMAISPWGRERLAPDTTPVLRHLRGDFFCLPFGGNPEPWRGRRYPVHGETATEPWRLVEATAENGSAELVARMRLRICPGEVTKRIELRRGETNVYCSHELAGLSGPMCLGHHAMLAFTGESGPGNLALSAWHEGRVCPDAFEAAEQGGYTSLKIGAPFRSLDRVPLAAGGHADLSRYPAREGFEDLVMVSARPSAGLAWSAVVFPKARYAWFSLKDPRTLASTVLWHSNGGRHYPPWSGRHRGVLGVEEVTGYFHLGIARSARPNPLSRRGVPTVLRFRPNRPLVVKVIMGVAALPSGFERVASIRFGGDHIVLVSDRGLEVAHGVSVAFL